EQAWAIEEQKIKQLSTRERAPIADLNAKISIVDGATELANNDKSNNQMCDNFEQFIVEHYGR
ncbi:peptidase M3, partial [Vibrio breoganii]